MNKNIIIIILVTIVTLMGTYYFYLNTPETGVDGTTVVNTKTNDIQEYFNERLREGVLERVGQPIEGFIPSMFLQAFSGIVPQDFDGAGAQLGKYKIVEKEQ